MVLDDTSKESKAVLNELYRAMTPAKKVALVFEAYRFGQQLAMAGLRQQYPDATDSQVWHMWARKHLGDELYEKAYGNTAAPTT